MSLFSSLYTGTAGLMAQTKSTNVISENIANLNTTGYKRQEVAFHELVANNSQTVNGSNSVTSDRINRIDQQGGVLTTSSATDLAIVGDGFFVVREPGAAQDDAFRYTRNGTFQEDAFGILRNSAGFELYGWPIDQNGVVATGTTTDSLEVVDIDLLATQTLPTTFGEMIINLDAGETRIDPHTLIPAQTLPVSNQQAQFGRSLSVYDQNGTEQLVTLDFRRTVGPMAHFTSDTSTPMNITDSLVDNPTGPTPGITAGDTLTLEIGTFSLDVNFVAAPADTSLNEANTLQDVVDVINNYTISGLNRYRASVTDEGRLLVQSVFPTDTVEITNSDANVLGATGLNFIQDPDGADYTYEPEALVTTNSLANPQQTSFPAFDNLLSANPFGWWEVSVTTVDPTDPTSGTNVERLKGLINFNGDGSLNAVTNADGQAILDLGTLTFDDATPGSEVTMTLDIGSFTQFSGDYNVLLADQNGAPVGTLTGIEVTREGIVQSVFNNGIRVDSYQIPLADFTNVNGLERISGTAFAETEGSGAPTIGGPTENGLGSLLTASLENSNVDLSNEFSLMIVNQRAFSLNSRLITTVDEMTELVGRLKR